MKPGLNNDQIFAAAGAIGTVLESDNEDPDDTEIKLTEVNADDEIQNIIPT